jgi:hypothetical protein
MRLRAQGHDRHPGKAWTQRPCVEPVDHPQHPPWPPDPDPSTEIDPCRTNTQLEAGRAQTPKDGYIFGNPTNMPPPAPLVALSSFGGDDIR